MLFLSSSAYFVFYLYSVFLLLPTWHIKPDDTIRYDSGYLTCSKKLTGSQLSLPHGSLVYHTDDITVDSISAVGIVSS